MPSLREGPGTRWYARVPAGWSRIEIKRAAKRITDGAHISPETEGGVYDFVSTKDLLSKGINFEGSLKTTPESYIYLLRMGCRPVRGDLLFSKDGTVGRTALIDCDHEFVVASSLVIIRPSKNLAYPRFLQYLCDSEPVQAQVRMYVKGAGLPRLSISNLRRVWGLFPPISEQRAISEFLDHETAKIDELIAKQDALIELLGERRNAVIKSAITRGLDPDVPMKDSGSNWIGRMPASWPLKRLSWIFAKIGSGTTPANDELLDDGADHFWVTTGELRENVINQTIKGVSDQTLASYSALRLFPPGTLLIAMYGATIGRLATLGVEACTNQACCALSEPRDASPRFVFYALQAAQEHLLLLASGGGQPNINQEKLRSLRLPTPPLRTQKEIAAHLDREVADIEGLVTRAQRFISLLRERRSALITAAVTGKIDVREAA